MWLVQMVNNEIKWFRKLHINPPQTSQTNTPRGRAVISAQSDGGGNMPWGGKSTNRPHNPPCALSYNLGLLPELAPHRVEIFRQGD